MIPIRDQYRCALAGQLKREIPGLYAYIGPYGHPWGLLNSPISIFFDADARDDRIDKLNTMSNFPLYGNHSSFESGEYALRPPCVTLGDKSDKRLASKLGEWKEFLNDIETYMSMMWYYGLDTGKAYVLIPELSSEEMDFHSARTKIREKEDEIYSEVVNRLWEDQHYLFGTLPKWLKICFRSFSYLVGRVNSKNMAKYYRMCKGTLKPSDYDSDLAELKETTEKIMRYEKDLSDFANKFEQFSKDIIDIGERHFPYHEIFTESNTRKFSFYSFEKHIYQFL